MYHIFSLLLGILALGTAACGAKKPNFRFFSMNACALSVLCQLMEQSRLARLGDISAIYDTVPTAAKLAAALFCGTVILNLITMYRGYIHEK